VREHVLSSYSVFRTSHRDVNINETSSYLDLSPLYGYDQASQDKVRKRDGRGMLYNDVFAEERLLFLPPAVCALLVLFCRNHNVRSLVTNWFTEPVLETHFFSKYVAKKLLEINERGNYIDPSVPSEFSSVTERLLHQDEEIFQTARLINSTWFVSVVFSDYLDTILGLVREGNSWSLRPLDVRSVI
jgi:linoleate 10R-lipoxygenase